ncbi:hypothetical protein BH23GEM6_BH23GEM6_10910 [soil metagenome]
MHLSRAIDDHRAAMKLFVDALGAVSRSAWNEPRAPGKWSPAEVAEHLVLTYEAVLKELSGDPAMRLKLSSVRRRVLKWFLLPHILFHRSFPLAAVSPRELRPSSGAISQEDVGPKLLDLASRFEDAMSLAVTSGAAGVTHPYFGTIPPLRALRFITVHLEHHTRQIPAGEAATG